MNVLTLTFQAPDEGASLIVSAGPRSFPPSQVTVTDSVQVTIDGRTLTTTGWDRWREVFTWFSGTKDPKVKWSGKPKIDQVHFGTT